MIEKKIVIIWKSTFGDWGWSKRFAEKGKAYHVVAVDMHGMYGNIEVVYDQTDAFIVAKIVDVPFGIIRVGVIFLLR